MRMSTLAGVIALVSAAVYAQGTFSTPSGSYTATWTVSGNSLDVTVTAMTTGWVGFGVTLGNLPHRNVDMVICRQNGANFMVEDRYVDGFVQPSLDVAAAPADEVTLVTSSEVAGRTMCRFTKPLTARDNTDVTIPNANVLVHWAYGAADTFQQHAGNARGTFTANLRATGLVTAPPTLAPTMAPTTAPTPATPLQVGIERSFSVANGNYVLTWSLVDADTIQFEIDAANAGWVGVGFTNAANRAHISADMIVCLFNGNTPTITDRYSTDFAQPQVDNTLQNVNLVSLTRANGRTVCTFTRDLNTLDLTQDVAIPAAGITLRVDWAYGATDQFTQHAGAARGSLVQDILSATNNLMTTVGAGSFSANNGDYTLSWTPVLINAATPGLEFTMTARTTGWVAMGLLTRPAANSHTNADMIVGYVANGAATISDRFSLTFGVPQADTTSNVILVSGTEANGMTTIVFRRALNTGDAIQDVAIPLAGNLIGLNWAYGTTDDFPNNKHQDANRGSVLYDILGNQQFIGGSGNFATADGAYTLSWMTSVMQGEPAITFTMTAQTNGWVAMGLLDANSPNGAHINSDMIVGYVANGQGVVEDRYSVQFARPDLDASDDVNLGSLTSAGVKASRQRVQLLQATEANGQTSITFNRLLDTGDNQDTVIPDAGNTVQLLVAYGADDAFNQKHADNARMRMTMDLLGGNANGQGTTAAQGRFSTPDGSYVLTYTRMNDMIQFTMDAATTGWVGVGIAPGNGITHAQDDIIYGFVANGAVTLVDTYSTAQAQPVQDNSQDISGITGTEANGRTTITFMRPITATEAATDITIPDATVRFAWAYGANDNLGTQHAGNARGSASANLLRGGNAVAIVGRAYSPAGLYAIVLGIILGAYSLLHITYKYYKVLKLAICGASAKEADFVSTDPEAPLTSTPFNQYYVGSTAVPYDGAGPAPTGFGGDGEPSFSPKTAPSAFASNIEPLLIEEKKVKGSASNYLNSVLHSRVPYSQITVRDFILLFLFLFLNVGFLFIWNDPFYDYIVTFGYLTVANAFFVSVPATRNSVLVFLMGLPFDHAILFHRFVGQIIFVEATAHYLGYIIPWAQQGIVSQQLMIYKYMVGLIAWIGVAVVYLTSLEFIRRKAFNFFFLTHFTFFAFFIAGSYHTPAFLPFAIAAAVVYGIDRLLRTFWSSFPVSTTEFKQLPGGLVRVKFPKHCAAKYELGQYVFINFPGIAPLQWHPFTLANGPDEPELEVDIRSLGDHTKKILKIAENNESVLIRADGPYGEWPFNYARYKKVLLVAGGVGVTPCVAALRHIYHINRVNPKAEAVVQEVYFVWSCQNEETFGWFKDILEEVWAKSGRDGFPVFKPFIYITRAESVSDSRLIPGRPQLDRVFIDMLTDDVMAMRLCVIACGPKGLINDAWDNTTQNTKGSTRIDFHHETFDF